MPDAEMTGPTGGQVDGEGVLPYTYTHGSASLEKAHIRFSGARGLLAGAAQALAESTAYDLGKNSPQSSDDEIKHLADFACASGLMMDATAVRAFMAEHAMRGGSEHKVAYAIKVLRVIKDLDTRAINTESLFDYLTDLELSNFFFGDDLRLEGFFEDERGRLHIVTSQPWRDGPHPDLSTLKAYFIAHGFETESTTGGTGMFFLQDEKAGRIDLFDIKPDNVILEGDTGVVQPVDIHFYFDNHADREKALLRLGLRSSD
jgi:Serine/Threonine/Tyrosine Kinase found in polyvalent proteins